MTADLRRVPRLEWHDDGELCRDAECDWPIHKLNPRPGLGYEDPPPSPRWHEDGARCDRWPCDSWPHYLASPLENRRPSSGDASGPAAVAPARRPATLAEAERAAESLPEPERSAYLAGARDRGPGIFAPGAYRRAAGAERPGFRRSAPSDHSISVQHGTQKQVTQAPWAAAQAERESGKNMSSIGNKQSLFGDVPKVGHLAHGNGAAENTLAGPCEKNAGAERVQNGATLHFDNALGRTPPAGGGCPPEAARVPGDLAAADRALSALLATGYRDPAALNWSGQGGGSERLTKGLGWLTFARRCVARAEVAARLALDVLSASDVAPLETCALCLGSGVPRLSTRRDGTACLTCGGAGKVHPVAFLSLVRGGANVHLAAQLIEQRGSAVRLRHGDGPETWWDLETGKPVGGEADTFLALSWELSEDTRRELGAVASHPWKANAPDSTDIVGEWLAADPLNRQVRTSRSAGGSEWTAIAVEEGGVSSMRHSSWGRAEAERLAVFANIEVTASVRAANERRAERQPQEVFRDVDADGRPRVDAAAGVATDGDSVERWQRRTPSAYLTTRYLPEHPEAKTKGPWLARAEESEPDGYAVASAEMWAGTRAEAELLAVDACRANRATLDAERAARRAAKGGAS